MAKIHCLDCGYEGKAKKYTKGSVVIEIFLWLMLFVPGFIYSLWRITSGRYKGCPDCRSDKVMALRTWEKREAQRLNEAV